MSHLYSCIFCDKLCDDQQISLTTGGILHHDCHNALTDKFSKCNELIADISGRNAWLKERLRRANSMFYKLRRAVGGEVINIGACQREVTENNDTREKLVNKKDEITKILTLLYDYWPSYPPDWEARKDVVRAGIRGCERCASSRYVLHVHHKQPLARGGNHKAENLIVLCEKCHSKKHGGREFTYEDNVNESSFEKKLKVLRSAITSEQMIRFSYTRRDGRQSVRTISPHGFKTIEKSLCINGYCYLRKEQRTFAIRRMKKLSIVDDPGNNYYKKRKR